MTQTITQQKLSVEVCVFVRDYRIAATLFLKCKHLKHTVFITFIPNSYVLLENIDCSIKNKVADNIFYKEINLQYNKN